MNEPLQDFNTLDLADTSDIRLAQLEQWIGRSLCEELAKHYPNRNWSAAVDTQGGLVVIQETDISNTKGYVLSLARPMSDLRIQMARVGGEILERAGLSRDKTFDADVLDDVPRSLRGSILTPDLHAPEEPRFGSS